jgi:alpha-ribazole phosphatase
MRLQAPAAIVICHAGTIRLLLARARGLALDAMALEAAQRPHAIGYGETVILDCV